jgi:putative transposase
MPRRPRQSTGQFVFHVFNRAVENVVLFANSGDYAAFLRVLAEGVNRHGMPLLVYAIMHNHWHLVVWPRDDASLSVFMQWVTGTHARRWRDAGGSTGRGALYQGRYKAIAVQRDRHFLRLCHYVERNPSRAHLVARAEDWPWSSASPLALGADRPALAPWPVPKPQDWLERLNVPEPARSVEELRQALKKGMPFGNPAWRAGAMRRLKWRVSSRPPGRPKMAEDGRGMGPTIQ